MLNITHLIHLQQCQLTSRCNGNFCEFRAFFRVDDSCRDLTAVSA